MDNFNLKLKSQPYSKREAWDFIQSHGPELTCSIRNLGNLWKWHKSKVERFLKALKSETLIETEIRFGKTTIVMIVESKVKEASNFNIQNNSETKNLSLIPENLSRDNFADNIETAATQAIHDIKRNDETESRQTRDNLASKEEKKKRSKKRKEEIKEKPLLKEGKKEKNIFEKDFSGKQLLAIEAEHENEAFEEAKQVIEEISTKLPVLKNYPNSVVAEDVIDWVEKNLPKDIDIDIEWELEKFKDYQRSRNKKTVKDAISYFKNWLRKAAEFKQEKLQNKSIGGNYHEFFKHKQNKQPRTEFERFFAGGLRALASLSECRLVG